MIYSFSTHLLFEILMATLTSFVKNVECLLFRTNLRVLCLFQYPQLIELLVTHVGNTSFTQLKRLNYLIRRKTFIQKIPMALASLFVYIPRLLSSFLFHRVSLLLGPCTFCSFFHQTKNLPISFLPASISLLLSSTSSFAFYCVAGMRTFVSRSLRTD